MRELDICPADDADVLDDFVCLLLQSCLKIFRDREHRSSTEGIACVDTERVNIFNEADRDHVVVPVADYFELKLFPAENRFLDEDLMNEGCLQAAGHDDLELFPVVDKSAAGAAHRIGRTQNDRIAETVGDLKTFLHRVGYLAPGHLDAKLCHGLLEFDTVLAALNGVDLDTDDLDIVLVENAFLIELGGEIQTGLAAEVRQQGVRTLLRNDLFEPLDVQRFDIGDIGHFGIRHNSGRVRIDQNNFVAEAAEGLACLCAGVIELAGLTDHDRS